MKSIVTKYLPATNLRGSRIKATCQRGSITISYPHDLSGEAVHVAAADALVAKFAKEDAARYGANKNPWLRPRVVGCLPDNTYVHCFAGIENSLVINFASFEDRQQFENCHKKAKQTNGTIAPLYCGLLSSVLKRATI